MKPTRSLLIGAAATATAVQVGPAATWLPPVRRAFPRLSGRGREGHLALTFDDGPDPLSTPHFLDVLAALRWRATFFVLGDQVRRAPGVVRELADAGHEIGVHGDRHGYLIARGPRAAADDLARALDAVSTACGQPVRWWRPPYGVLSGPALLAARRVGVRPVLWSAWGRDWRAEATGRSVVEELTAGVLDGGTALLHDSDITSAPGAWRAALAALPLLADVAEQRALTVGPLAEHW